MEQYPKTPLRYLWFYIRQKKWQVFWMFFLMGLSTICTRLTLYYFSHIIDILNENIRTNNMLGNALLPTIIMMVLLDVLWVIFKRWSFSYDYKFFPWLTMQAEKDVSHYLMGHSARFLANQTSGKLASRAGQLSGNLDDMLERIEYDFFVPAISVLITFSMLMGINWMCGVLFLIWTGVLFLIFKKYGCQLRNVSLDFTEKKATVVGQIVDIVANALTVKGFSNWRFEEKLLNNHLIVRKKSFEKLIATHQNIQVAQNLTISAFKISMIGLTLFLWQKGKVSAGNIVLTLLLVNTILESLRHFMFSFNGWSRLSGSVKNALDAVFSTHEIQDAPSAQKLKAKKGQIEFKDVNFGYRSKTGVFKKFNLFIKPGERIGLVGVSGSGKTSLINLLQRFYDVNSGQILIDGQDIRSVTQDSLHSAISFVPQDTSLFHRSLYENIAYGNPKANKNQIMRASRLAYAHEFITKTEKGYQTLVGDRGVKLSGGQRQRIAIARAILKRAPILILDEATSALDSESEIHIQKSLKTLMKGKTVIAIAHRLSTLREMDRIIVMQKGKIIEEGKPSELLKKKGKYAHLWELQTQGFILSE